MFRLHPLEADFTIDVLPSSPVRPAALEARVDAIWAAEQRVRDDRLFNGRILSLVEYSPHRLTLQRSEYRYLVARLRQPSMADELDVRPVGVTGVLTCRDGLVLGRRADAVTQDAGRWESAPAGVLDQPDAYAQVRDELREEVGITADRLTSCRAIVLVEGVATGVQTIIFDLRTSLTASDVHAAHASATAHEYAELAVVPRDHLSDYVAEHQADIQPALIPILQAAGLLPARAPSLPPSRERADSAWPLGISNGNRAPKAGRLSLRRASIEDAGLIRAIRNDADVRRVSWQTAVVQPDEHAKWLTNKLADPESRLYVIVAGGDDIGQIRLDRRSADEAEVSLALLQDWRGKGFGREAIVQACEAAFHDLGVSTVVAEIKTGNAASESAFASAGFSDTRRSRTKVEMRLAKPV